MPEELDSYQDKGNKPNWWDMSLEFGIACMSSKLKSWEMSAFLLGTVRWEHNSCCFITMNIIFSFFVFISLTFFLYCCISEFFFLWLSLSFKSGCQRICRARHRHCQVCCVNCNSLICPTFLFQTKVSFCPMLLCLHPSLSRRLFLSLSVVCLRDRFSFVVRALDCRAGDPEFDISRCDLKSFFRLLSFPCSLK